MLLKANSATNFYEVLPWILTIFRGADPYSWPPIALKALSLPLITVITPIRFTIGAETDRRADAPAFSPSLSRSLLMCGLLFQSRLALCSDRDIGEWKGRWQWKAEWDKEREEWMIKWGSVKELKAWEELIEFRDGEVQLQRIIE